MKKNIKSFLLRVGSEDEPIELLSKFLIGRVFNFKYLLVHDNNQEISIENQKLSNNVLHPIRLETRGKGDMRKEYLVFVVEDTDDLIVSVSRWRGPLSIDFSEESDGLVTVTNYDGERYQFTIQKDNKN